MNNNANVLTYSLFKITEDIYKLCTLLEKIRVFMPPKLPLFLDFAPHIEKIAGRRAWMYALVAGLGFRRIDSGVNQFSGKST